LESEQANGSNIAHLKEELILALGAFLQSKQMKELYTDKTSKNKVDLYKDLLYKYANKILEKLLKVEGFRFLIRHFITKYGEEMLERHTDITENREDLVKGIQFLKELIDFYENKP
jgi:hypothetical protein